MPLADIRQKYQSQVDDLTAQCTAIQDSANSQVAAIREKLNILDAQLAVIDEVEAEPAVQTFGEPVDPSVHPGAVDANGVPILDAQGNPVPADANGNPVDPAQAADALAQAAEPAQ